METKGFCQFEIIVNVLVSYFRFIWIPLLLVYDHYNFSILPGPGPSLDTRILRLRRLILTSKGGHFAERIKTDWIENIHFILIITTCSAMHNIGL